MVLNDCPFPSNRVAKAWRLCRARHNLHYAECLVMPSCPFDLTRSPVIFSADVLADSA